MKSRYRSFILLTLAAAVMAIASCARFSPAPASTVADAQMVGDAYMAALEANNASGAAEFWTDDGEFVNMATGDSIRGRDAIRTALTGALESGVSADEEPGTFVAEMIGEDAVIEKGRTWMLDEDGSARAVKSATLYVKRGDAWKIHRVWSAPEDIESNYEHLAPLSWMIGEWTMGADDKETKNVYRWTKNRNYISRTFRITGEGPEEITGGEMIGWDPFAEIIRSWTFDSDGAFSVAMWDKFEDDGKIKPKIIMEIAPCERPAREAALNRLAWLVGEWTDQRDGHTMNYECRMARNNSWITIKWEDASDSISGQDGLIIIGWDDAEQLLKTWTFDTDGGFAEGYLEGEGNRWLLVNTHVLPGGDLGASVTIYKKIDDNSISWQRVSQEIGGVLLPDEEENILIRRAGGQ